MKKFLAWIKPRVVYVEVAPPKQTLDREAEASIPSLAGHPGFQELLHRLDLQRAVLETRLKTTQHESLRSVDLLQLGIFWIGFLQREVDKRVYKDSKKSRYGLIEAEEAIKVASLIEKIGDNAN